MRCLEPGILVAGVEVAVGVVVVVVVVVAVVDGVEIPAKRRRN